MEIFKSITDYPNYEISNLGRLKSLERISLRGFKLKEKLIKGGIDTRGYQMIHLVNNGVRKTLLVHRLVAKEFIPNPENKYDINHIDGIKTNNFDYNLEWCTTQENIIHAYANGLCSDKTGETNGRSLLTEKEVLEIRQIKNKRISEIAKNYNVSWSCISSIIKRKNWSHI